MFYFDVDVVGLIVLPRWDAPRVWRHTDMTPTSKPIIRNSTRVRPVASKDLSSLLGTRVSPSPFVISLAKHWLECCQAMISKEYTQFEQNP